MLAMTSYKRGDIFLVDFGFSEGIGFKKRLVLIISTEAYHKNRQEVTVSAITGNIERALFGDTKIEKWRETGLIYQPLVTGIVRTIKNTMLINKLGTLLQQDFQNVQKNLKKSLGL